MTPTSEKFLNYDSFIINREGFKNATVVCSGLGRVWDAEGDSSTNHINMDVTSAIEQVGFLTQSGISEDSARIIAALSPRSDGKAAWDWQVKVFKSIKTVFPGIGGDFMVAAGTTQNVKGAHEYTFGRFQEMQKLGSGYIDSIGGVDMAMAQVSVMPPQIDDKLTFQRLANHFTSFSLGGIDNELAGRLLAARFGPIIDRAVGGIEVRQIVDYLNRLKSELQIDTLSATLMTVIPVRKIRKYNRRLGERSFDITKSIFNNLKGKGAPLLFR